MTPTVKAISVSATSLRLELGVGQELGAGEACSGVFDPQLPCSVPIDPEREI